MRNYGYGSYHGRSKLRTFLKLVIIFLVAVLVVAVGAFFFLQQYIVYTANGPVLELPFLQREEVTPDPTATPQASPSLPVVVVSPTPTPTPTPTPVRAAVLPISAVSDGSAAQTLADQGANAAILDMKNVDGTLSYVSQVERAKSVNATGKDPAVNEAIRSYNADAEYTVARVVCFRDNLAPYMNNSLALRSTAGNWRDENGTRWMSPAVQAARDYVTDVCVELAGLGFDEILLDYAAFPTGERAARIVRGDAYDPEKLEEVVEQFYRGVKTALADTGVKLGICRAEEGSGQTAQLLAEYADHIWTETDGQWAVSP